MEPETQSIIPNSTQIPHLIIREWMPLLSDVELRVLLVVADQTLGWIEDPETKRRKEKDWISQGQLMKKINRSDRAIQNSLKRLIDELRIIQAHDELGELLDSPQKRMKCGGKIFYRLSLKRPQATPEKSSEVAPPKNLRAKNFRATKETGPTKIKSFGQASLDSNFNKNVDNPVDKESVPTRYFFGKFAQLCHGIRRTRPVFVKFKDGNLLKHALRHLTEFQLELELIWFLQNKPDMQPTIGAALCKEVINDFIQASFKEYGFYNSLERTALQYSKRDIRQLQGEARTMVDALEKLKASFGWGVRQEKFSGVLAERNSSAVDR